MKAGASIGTQLAESMVLRGDSGKWIKLCRTGAVNTSVSFGLGYEGGQPITDYDISEMKRAIAEAIDHGIELHRDTIAAERDLWKREALAARRFLWWSPLPSGAIDVYPVGVRYEWPIGNAMHLQPDNPPIANPHMRAEIVNEYGDARAANEKAAPAKVEVPK